MNIFWPMLGVSNLWTYFDLCWLQETHTRIKSKHVDSGVSYIYIYKKTLSSLSVSFHPDISLSLSCKFSTSPSVASMSSSVTCVTDQMSPTPSSSSVSSSSPGSFSTILPTQSRPSDLVLFPIQTHSLGHFVTHQTQHSDSVGTLMRLVMWVQTHHPSPSLLSCGSSLSSFPPFSVGGSIGWGLQPT